MRDFSVEDRRTRERLERNSPRGERSDLVSYLNSASENHVVIERSAADILTDLRRRANTPRDPQWHEPLSGDFRAGDNVAPGAGDADARRERYTPKLRAGRVGDAAGSMQGGNRDHWSSGQVTGVEEVLSVEDMRHNAARALRNRFF